MSDDPHAALAAAIRAVRSVAEPDDDVRIAVGLARDALALAAQLSVTGGDRERIRAMLAQASNSLYPVKIEERQGVVLRAIADASTALDSKAVTFDKACALITRALQFVGMGEDALGLRMQPPDRVWYSGEAAKQLRAHAEDSLTAWSNKSRRWDAVERVLVGHGLGTDAPTAEERATWEPDQRADWEHPLARVWRRQRDRHEPLVDIPRHLLKPG